MPGNKMRLVSIQAVRSLCTLTLLSSLSVPAFAEPPVTIDFARDVLPILSDNCFTCHGPDENSRKADLRLDTASGLLESHVVAAGEPAESELVRRLKSDDPDERMPPIDSKLTLTPDEIRKIELWIESGANWSGHWAYQPLKRPPLPIGSKFEGKKRLRNPIDAFVRAKLEHNNLPPAPEVSRERLIRRVTLDLTGLPPTLDEVAAFLSDPATDAFEKVVARLLSSPAYGERMAWPWLDAARYADTNGFQGDRERTMWPWRDWAIDAINRNMPFDRFTIMQVAGDQLPNASEEDRLATGFCRNHMINGEGGRIPAENRVEYIFDQIETVGTTWLGMTVQCCRCHDHKFDPVSQDEYYKLFAFFNQTPVNGGGGNPQTAPVLSVSNRPQRRQIETAESALRNAAVAVSGFEDAHAAIESQLQTGVKEEQHKKALKQTLATGPVSRSVDQLKQLEQLSKTAMPDYAALITNLRQRIEHRNQLKRSLPKVMVMEDMPLDKHRATHVLDRGLYNKPLHEVSAGVPAALPAIPNQEGAPPSRLDLAQWLVDDRNPLTARVTVNRIWQTFFGTGIVESVEDFGLQAKRPSHPQLLDWLATELIRSDWDTKHIVRLIVTSSTYRQSSKNSRSIEVDPANRLLARGPRFRMPAWMLRDQALSLSGLLVTHQGGPPVKPYQPKGIWADATFGKKRYEADRGENLYRRSIYVFWRRIVGPTMFFDGGKRQTCEVKLSRTNTPLHALATLNDVTYVEAARAMAERLYRDAPSSDQAKIKLAFRLATSRLPSDTEQTRLLDRLATLAKHYQKEESTARDLLSIGDSVRDESISAAEHAAYTCICLLILNLDETLTN